MSWGKDHQGGCASHEGGIVGNQRRRRLTAVKPEQTQIAGYPARIDNAELRRRDVAGPDWKPVPQRRAASVAVVNHRTAEVHIRRSGTRSFSTDPVQDGGLCPKAHRQPDDTAGLDLGEPSVSADDPGAGRGRYRLDAADVPMARSDRPW
jgi:hypothetical protein